MIEAKLDVGRGPVATVLVQKGTLKRGDIFVVGEQWGKVRALINDKGERVDEAGPSVPVEVLGLSGTPEAGDVLNVVDDEAKAREIASYRERLARDKRAAVGSATTLDQLLAKAKADRDVKELPVVVKSDVQGSAEAIVQALEKVATDEVRVRVLHSGVGAITEIDVTLAEASRRADHRLQRARQRAGARGGEPEGRRDPLLLDHLRPGRRREEGGLAACSAPEISEKFIGYAEILQVFKITGVGKVAGCRVTEGVARRSAGVRLLRDNVVIHEGKLKTLEALQGRGARGADRPGMRHGLRELRGHARRRRHRDLRDRDRSSASSPDRVRLCDGASLAAPRTVVRHVVTVTHRTTRPGLRRDGAPAGFGGMRPVALGNGFAILLRMRRRAGGFQRETPEPGKALTYATGRVPAVRRRSAGAKSCRWRRRKPGSFFAADDGQERRREYFIQVS